MQKNWNKISKNIEHERYQSFFSWQIICTDDLKKGLTDSLKAERSQIPERDVCTKRTIEDNRTVEDVNSLLMSHDIVTVVQNV